MENIQKDVLKEERKIKIGICAMDKKVHSKQMQNILKGLEAFGEFEIILICEDIIYNLDIEDWAIVDALIIFFSNGFPFTKALKYINLRKPFLINDFEMQKIFWDRRKVYQMLVDNDIPTPYHLVVDRGEEINNDGESSLKMNSSMEIEHMINLYTKNDNKQSSGNYASFNYGINNNFSKSNYNSENKAKVQNNGLNELSANSLVSLEEQYFKDSDKEKEKECTCCNTNTNSDTCK